MRDPSNKQQTRDLRDALSTSRGKKGDFCEMMSVTILALSRRANVKCFKLNIQGLKNITLVARLDSSVHEGTTSV